MVFLYLVNKYPFIVELDFDKYKTKEETHDSN